MLRRLEDWKPKLTILTPISEDEIKRYGWKHFEEMIKGKILDMPMMAKF
ncbi:MAG: hypothetical protein U9Q69_01825 [Nanoarchaeota archaeon]|nr:hypothetical protein [Nanoarchaeota archaeon]